MIGSSLPYRALLLPVAVLLAIAPALSGPARASGQQTEKIKEASRNYLFGAQALQAGNTMKAEKYFTKALAAFPLLPEAHLGMGQIAMREKRFTDALAEFEKARDCYGEAGDALFELRLERFNDAQEQIRRQRDLIRDLNNQLADGRVDETRVSMWIQEAETRIDQLRAINAPVAGATPSVPGETYFYIGNALFNLDRLDEAAEAWRACTEKSPEFPLAWNNLAVALWKKGRPTDALETLRRAESLGLKINADLRSDLLKAVGEAAPPS